MTSGPGWSRFSGRGTLSAKARESRANQDVLITLFCTKGIVWLDWVTQVEINSQSKVFHSRRDGETLGDLKRNQI